MSVLGEFVRLDPEVLEDVRRDPDPRHRVSHHDPAHRLDVDRFWEHLALLFDEAPCPINPIRAGTPFPDASSAWFQFGHTRSLSDVEVGQVAAYLAATPFDDLAEHVPAVARSLGRIGPSTPEELRSLEGSLPVLDLLPRDGLAAQARETLAAGGVFDERAEATVRDMCANLASLHGRLTRFFQGAAAAGQHTVFWLE